MRICFLDDDKFSDNVSDSSWKQSPSRRLLQIVYSYFAKINCAGEGEIQSIFNKGELHKAMQTVLEEEIWYNPKRDKSTTVILASTASRQKFKSGLYLEVKFDRNVMAAAVPLEREVARMEQGQNAVHYAFLNQYKDIELWDSKQSRFEETFFKYLTCDASSKSKLLSTVIIGRLCIYYMIQELIRLSQLREPPETLITTNGLSAKVLNYPITKTILYKHMYGSSTKAQGAFKNHKYEWTKIVGNNADPVDDYNLRFVIKELPGQAAKGQSATRVAYYEKFTEGMVPAHYKLACEQLMSEGRIDQYLVDSLSSFEPIVAKCDVMDSLVANPASRNLDQILMHLYGQYTISDQVLLYLLELRYQYLQLMLPLYHSIQQRDQREVILGLSEKATQFIRELRPSLKSMSISVVVKKDGGMT
jgi:hypothetical protein